MKEKEIIEGNRLINGYMGYPYNEYAYPLLYHKDWNLLMDVVKKINERDYVTIYCDECKIHSLIISEFETISIVNEDKPLIVTVWQAVVEYIKWYNENETRKKNIKIFR